MKIGNEAVAIKFIVDLLFAKGVITSAERELVLDAKTLNDLDVALDVISNGR